MTTRRKFVASSLAFTAGAAVPVAARGTSRSVTEDSAKEQPPLLDHPLLIAMQQRLTLALGDEEAARVLAGYLLDIGFHWSPPARPAAEITSIVGYSFGNRPPAPGSAQTLPDPGPVNAALADAVWQLYQRSHARIFVQWEIGNEFRKQHPGIDIVSIEPVTAKDGSITYLSTDGVAEAVVAHAGGAGALGVVGVIGHRDHAKRCVLTSRGRGMDAYVAREIILPVTYDAESGQPWTRSRDLYLVHDIAAQFAMLRAGLVSGKEPVLFSEQPA